MIEVRNAKPDDVKYIDSLQSKYSHELGFLPFAAIETYVRCKLVSIGSLNGEPASYLLGYAWSQGSPDVSKIVQACVQYDARHRALGTALVEQFIGRLDERISGIELWCAQDIDANAFWQACGFTARAWRLGKKEVRRVHILWTRRLPAAADTWTHPLPAETSGGMMRKDRQVVVLRPGEDWKQIIPEHRPDIVTQAWGAEGRPRVLRPRKKLIVAKTIPMILNGRIVQRPLAQYAGLN